MLLHSEFFDFVKDVWSLFVKRSPAYQLTRKIRMLHNAIKSWNMKHNNSNNYLSDLSKQLENILGKLMLNPSYSDLWLQEQSLQDQFHIAAVEQESIGSSMQRRIGFPLAIRILNSSNLLRLSAKGKIMFRKF